MVRSGLMLVELWDSKDMTRNSREQEIDVYLLPWVALDRQPTPSIRMKYRKLGNQSEHHCSLKDVENLMPIYRKIVRSKGQLMHPRLAKMLSRSYNLIVDFGIGVEAAIVEVVLAVWHHVEPMAAAV